MSEMWNGNSDRISEALSGWGRINRSAEWFRGKYICPSMKLEESAPLCSRVLPGTQLELSIISYGVNFPQINLSVSRAYRPPKLASVRKPSTSWMYHKGKVSLSPRVKMTAFGGSCAR